MNSDPLPPDDTTPDEPPLGYDRARRQAESLAGDPEATHELLERATVKAERVRDVKRVQGFFADLGTLFRMIRSRIRGDYPDMPWRALVAAIAAVVYFVNPFDVVPDVIPVIGYLDDAAVIAFVLRMLSGDLLRFREWESEPTVVDTTPS